MKPYAFVQGMFVTADSNAALDYYFFTGHWTSVGCKAPRYTLCMLP